MRFFRLHRKHKHSTHGGSLGESNSSVSWSDNVDEEDETTSALDPVLRAEQNAPLPPRRKSLTLMTDLSSCSGGFCESTRSSLYGSVADDDDEDSDEDDEYDHEDYAESVRLTMDDCDQDDLSFGAVEPQQSLTDPLEEHLPVYDMDDIVTADLLGEGTFCAVYSIMCFAREPKTAGSGIWGRPQVCSGASFKTDFALKRLHRNKPFKNIQSVVMDLATEGWLLQRLKHPNIVRVHALVNDPVLGGQALVVDRLYSTLREERKRWYKLEHQRSMDGNDTTQKAATVTPRAMSTQHLSQRRPKLFEHLHNMRLTVALDLAKAMAHLHKYRICHRDLKPSNVGFDSNGNVKLFDFGFSRTLPDQPARNRTPRLKIHRPKDTDSYHAITYRMTAKIGTWRYMAPEVALGKPYNLGCDVYSYSMLLWEILTGQKPLAEYLNGSEQLKKAVYTRLERPCIDTLDDFTCKSGRIPMVLEYGWTPVVSSRWTMRKVVHVLQEEFDALFASLPARY